MARLIIHKEVNLEAREMERHLRFVALSGEDKLKELFQLIHLTVLLGGKNGFKKPEGKGVVLGRK